MKLSRPRRPRNRKFLRSFLRFLSCKSRKVVDDEASPISTAWNSHDELSRPSDELTSVDDDQSDIQIMLSWKEKLYRSVRKMKRMGPQTEQRRGLLAYDTTTSSSTQSRTGEDDQRSSLFSTSTERKDAKEEKKVIAKERISLKEFIERDAMLPRSIQLGELSAQDSMSVESAFLAVSFDDDYPQLVLQASTDHSAKELASQHLGVTFPHPARKARPPPTFIKSPTSFDKKSVSILTTLTANTNENTTPETKQSTTTSSLLSSPAPMFSPGTPPWLDEKTHNVWEHIDDDTSDSVLAPIDSLVDRPAPTQIKRQMAEWEDLEDKMRWSFDDNSAVSLPSHVLNVLKQVDRPYDEFD